MTTTLGIIGAGNIGSAVARLAVAAGYDVVISNSRGPETVADLVAQLGAQAKAGTVAEAVEAGDFVVLAVPFPAALTLPAADLAGKIVIDATNYLADRDGNHAELDTGATTSSALIQQALPGVPVVKAGNNVDFIRLAQLARPKGAADRSALPIAGDDAAAKAKVADLLDTLGWDTVDLGPLADSWRTAPGQPAFVMEYMQAQPTEPPADPGVWFATAPGRAVSAARCQELLDSAKQA